MFQSKNMFSIVLAVVLSMAAATNYSSPAPVYMGKTSTYGVFAYSTITNTGPTIINGDMGLYPGSATPGFPLGIVLGLTQIANPIALLVKGDLGIAFADAASRAADQIISGDLGGLTLGPGVYVTATTIGITGILYLDAQNKTDACWIFQIGTTLDVAVGASVIIINQPLEDVGSTDPNVFWQVGSLARLKTSSSIVGVIIAWQSIAVGLGCITGPLLAANAAVTLMANSITARVLPGTSQTASAGSANNASASSQGAKAGIALACIVIFLAIIGFVYYMTVGKESALMGAAETGSTKSMIEEPESPVEQKVRYEGVEMMNNDEEDAELDIADRV